MREYYEPPMSKISSCCYSSPTPACNSCLPACLLACLLACLFVVDLLGLPTRIAHVFRTDMQQGLNGFAERNSEGRKFGPSMWQREMRSCRAPKPERKRSFRTCVANFAAATQHGRNCGLERSIRRGRRGILMDKGLESINEAAR